MSARGRARPGLMVLGMACVASASFAPAAHGQDAVDPVLTENLTTLGKVWGFVKYHHPRVTEGEFDIDERLLELLPLVMEAPDRDAALDVMSTWVARLGPVDACTVCAVTPPDVSLAAPVEWISDATTLGTELSSQLGWIYRNRPTGGSQHYVSHQPGVGNPLLRNEEGYPAATEPDVGLRLLALYRFWNVIAYWFPYRDLLDQDLDEILAESVPEMLSATDRASYRLALFRLIAKVKDTHANLWGSVERLPPGGTRRVPVSVRFIEDRAVVVAYLNDGLGPETGLRVGDVIVSVDDVPVERLIEEWEPLYAASNRPTRLRDIGQSLLRGATERVDLTVERDGTRFDTTVSRASSTYLDRTADRTHDLAGPAFQMLTPDVAYLKLSSVVADSATSYVERARGTRVFVIDIRNYPSEFVVFALGRHLVAERTPFARFTSAAASNPGVFTMGAPVALEPQEPFYEGRVVILVDEVSQSQAEYTAMAFRTAPDAIVVGSTTAGADGNVSPIPLPGGLRSLISGIGVFYPDGSPTQRVGIVPDIRVTPTLAGIRAGRDEVLESAVSAALGRPFRLAERPEGASR